MASFCNVACGAVLVPSSGMYAICHWSMHNTITHDDIGVCFAFA